MSEITLIILYAGLSGITVFTGGLLSNYFNHHITEQGVKTVIIHTSIAFGGGIILSALALVLVPKGMENLSVLRITSLFIIGALTFFFLDRYLERKGGQIGQLMAMLMDFIPEAIVLGAIFAVDPNSGILLALFIGLQNLPESFNSFRDLVASGFSIRNAHVTLFFLSFSGIAGALIGYYFLQDLPTLTSSLMIFASGGILYLTFQDIAPASKLKQSWLPALGANFGFLVGMVGEKLL